MTSFSALIRPARCRGGRHRGWRGGEAVPPASMIGAECVEIAGRLSQIGLRDSHYITHAYPPLPYSNSIEITIMAERILITCKSQDVPGANEDKVTLLTNQACQIVWNRDFDKTLGDRLTMEGEFSYGVRCFILVDNGPVDSIDCTISFFRWNGKNL